jgi:hypothetical protein
MSILSRLLGVGRTEPLSLHTMVANELRLLVCQVVARSDMFRKNQIREAASTDTMQWFRIRQSGAEEGCVIEIVGHPRSEQLWPFWMKLVPVDELETLASTVTALCVERAPEGGPGMDEENRFRSVCELTGALMGRLSEMEAESRRSGQP